MLPKIPSSAMSRRDAVRRLATWSALFAAAPRLWAQATGSRPAKVLFFTKSSNYEHSVIRHTGGQPGLAETVVQRLAARDNLEVTLSKDGSRFSPDYLAGFDAFLFYTTGDLLTPGTDRQPPMTAAGKQALLDAVAGGKGFVGLHSAADTFHTGETGATDTKGERASRYRNYGADVDPYIAMLGGEFIRHGAQQETTLRVVDPSFPGCAALGPERRLKEEWYSLKDYRSDLHVIAVQETAGMQGNVYQRPPYPSTWARRHQQGRVFYTSLGHRDDVWNAPFYQAMLAGALAWAAGRVEAALPPNLDAVAPGANHLPPMEHPTSPG